MRRVLAPLISASLLGVAALVVPTPAHAVYEVCNPYSLQDFRDQMSALQKALDEYDLNEARYQAETAEKQARCISEPVTPDDVGRFAVLRAQMYFLDSKTDNAAEWMLTKLSATGPALSNDIGEEHPLRLVLRDIMIEDHGRVSAGQAVPPKKGIVLYNGRMIQDAASWDGVVGLVQVFDKKGTWVEGFWVSGSEWTGEVRSQYVASDAKAYNAPSWWTGQSHSEAPELGRSLAIVLGQEAADDPVVADPTDKPDKGDKGDGPPKPPKDKPPKTPKPPKEPGNGPSTGMLSTGLGMVALGGTLWGVSAAINGSAPEPGTYDADQLANRRTTVNALGTSALAAAVVGVGLTTVAFVGHNGGGLRLRGRW